jgi:hypothetical protein
MPLYTFLHNLLNVLVQIANKMGSKKSLREYVFTKPLPSSNWKGGGGYTWTSLFWFRYSGFLVLRGYTQQGGLISLSFFKKLKYFVSGIIWNISLNFNSIPPPQM